MLLSGQTDLRPLVRGAPFDTTGSPMRRHSSDMYFDAIVWWRRHRDGASVENPSVSRRCSASAMRRPSGNDPVVVHRGGSAFSA